MRKLTGFLLGLSLSLAGLPLLGVTPSSTPSHTGTYESNNSSHLNQITWLSDFSEGIRQSQATKKPVLILFTGTNWCPACMKLEREVLKKPEFNQALAQQFIFVKAEFPKYSEEDIQRSPYKQLLDRYRVSSFPTIILVNQNAEKISDAIKYEPAGPNHYITLLRQKLNQYAQQRQAANR